MKFIQDITFGQYVEGASFVHRLDPRVKVLSVFILLPLIFTSHNPLSLFFLILTAFIATALSRVASFMVKGIKYFFWLFIFAAVFHFFFTPGEPVPYISFVTYEGAREGTLVMAQLMLSVMFSNLLIFTTTPLELTMALERLLSPLKRIGVPVSDLSMMALIAIRFIPILEIEAGEVVKGRKVNFASRGFAERVKALPLVLAPLINNSFKRADDMAAAMVARGYLLEPGENLKEMRFGVRGYATLGFVLLMAYLSII